MAMKIGLSVWQAKAGASAPSVPANAIKDRAGDPILDRNGDYILERE